MSNCGVDQVTFNQKRKSLGAEVTRTERFRQEKVQRFDSEYRMKASNHSTGRNEAVAELLCYLSLLRTSNDIPQQAAVNWDRAHVQSVKASQGGNVGAHVLPCQILIAGQRPSDIIPNNVLNRSKIQNGLRLLFGKVTVLPKVFNIADSRAENNCLRGSLVAACESVIRETKPVQRTAGVLRRGVGANYGEIQLKAADLPAAGQTVGVDHNAVKNAYEVWRREARATFDRTIRAVRQTGATSDGEDVSEQVIYILERYRESLNQSPAKLMDRMMYQLMEELWQ
jgi:hypothetical protein